MTKITIVRQNGEIVYYDSFGHVGHANEGEDIYCAAISVILQFPIANIDDVLGVYPKIETKQNGDLKVDFRGVPTNGKEREIKALLETMYYQIKQMTHQFPHYFRLIEKEEI